MPPVDPEGVSVATRNFAHILPTKLANFCENLKKIKTGKNCKILKSIKGH